MRKTITATLAFCLLGAGAVAQADGGDHKNSCNRGEICFSQGANGGDLQNHFWFDGTHDKNFFNVKKNERSGKRLKRAAQGINNRDTSCHVQVYHNDGGKVRTWNFGNHPNYSHWEYMGKAAGKNDGHKRVNC